MEGWNETCNDDEEYPLLSGLIAAGKMANIQALCASEAHHALFFETLEKPCSVRGCSILANTVCSSKYQYALPYIFEVFKKFPAKTLTLLKSPIVNATPDHYTHLDLICERYPHHLPDLLNCFKALEEKREMAKTFFYQNSSSGKPRAIHYLLLDNEHLTPAIFKAVGALLEESFPGLLARYIANLPSETQAKLTTPPYVDAPARPVSPCLEILHSKTDDAANSATQHNGAS